MNDDKDLDAIVLLIEGDQDSRSIFVRSIAMNFPGITVDVAPDPDSAVDMLGKKEYDIVVCDAFMARDARVEFAQLLCSVQSAPLLLITAHSDLQKDSLPEHVCVREVLHKPLNLEDLVARIKAAAIEARKRKGAAP